MRYLRIGIVHPDAGRFKYEIREIVAVAETLRALGVEMKSWENIGDPVHKGEALPDWIKEIIGKLVATDETYGYTATQGLLEAREFLSRQVNARGGCQITPKDIIFFNGLGDAVARLFGTMKREARIIGPSPAYPTHSSAEAAHSGYEHLTYDLVPEKGWMPNLEELENKIRYNDTIAGILLINPGNPTGTVYPRDILEKIVAIARRYRVMVIADEIYCNILYNGAQTAHLSEVIGDVPGIALKGISKEYPWPGGRCGWIEVFNQDRDQDFAEYITSVINAKMLEVCSTSLPQHSIPIVMSDPRYPGHMENRLRAFEHRVNEAVDIFEATKGIHIIRPQGAFYMPVLFDEGVLNDRQTLPIANPKARAFVEEKVQGVPADKRFAYYLLAACGICVVPLTGFCSERFGFRVTVLEVDDEKRVWTWRTIAKAIETYLAS
ncbi:MAG: pyridoxal phosphate-dependent aminotransferase [Proteobacteria bacterium]|nr:pyridoxal phosphate-dependent aminotransferase [Pseudomonadota bacterium]